MSRSRMQLEPMLHRAAQRPGCIRFPFEGGPGDGPAKPPSLGIVSLCVTIQRRERRTALSTPRRCCGLGAPLAVPQVPLDSHSRTPVLVRTEEQTCSSWLASSRSAAVGQGRPNQGSRTSDLCSCGMAKGAASAVGAQRRALTDGAAEATRA